MKFREQESGMIGDEMLLRLALSLRYFLSEQDFDLGDLRSSRSVSQSPECTWIVPCLGKTLSGYILVEEM